MKLTMPPTIPVKELLETSAEYNADEIEDADALYHGGKMFVDRIERFLLRRKIEERDKKHYDLRKSRSFYSPYVGGLVDFLAAKAFANGIKIDAVGDPSAVAYYEQLNRDVDGFGKDLQSFATDILVHVLLFGRAYTFADFASPEIRPWVEAEARAVLRMIEPSAIDDWQVDETGVLEWVRLHTVGKIRDEGKPYLQPTKQLHTWAFFDESDAYIYQAEQELSGRWLKDAAMLSEVRHHGLGACPVLDARPGESMNIMDRVKSVAVALFNREASLTWSLDMAAYATLILTLDSTKISEIVSSELAALKLRVGETAGYIAPPAAIFEPLFKDADRLKNNLLEVVRGQGINAADLPQAGRLSGTAVRAMADPAEALISGLSDVVVELLQRTVEVVQRKRRDANVVVRVVLGEAPSVVADLTAKPETQTNGTTEKDRNATDFP